MGIDRIGKGGTGPVGGAGDATKAEGASRPFEARVDEATAKGVERAQSAAASTPLEKLRTGEVDVHGYIDLQVDEATAHLKGLGGDELETIKSMLHAELANDPGLAELVRRATGQLPTSND